MAVCRYCLCFLGWWRMKWPMMQLHTWLTWFRQTLVWPTCGKDNTASVCTLFTQHGSELLHSSVCFVSHCLLVCRLISNQFTVEGIRQLAEALTHNKALKEIWWASVQIDNLTSWSFVLPSRLCQTKQRVGVHVVRRIIWSPTYSGYKLKLVRDGSVTVRLLNALLSLPT